MFPSRPVRILLHIAVLVMLTLAVLAEEVESKALTPSEAREAVGKEITVTFVVKAAKDRLEKRKEIYLDAEEDFRSEANFAVVITVAGAASLKAQGIDAPAEHFKDKKIWAKGVVKVVQDVPRIEIDSAEQLKIVE